MFLVCVLLCIFFVMNWILIVLLLEGVSISLRNIMISMDVFLVTFRNRELALLRKLVRVTKLMEGRLVLELGMGEWSNVLFMVIRWEVVRLLVP